MADHESKLEDLYDALFATPLASIEKTRTADGEVFVMQAMS